MIVDDDGHLELIKLLSARKLRLNIAMLSF